MKRYISLSLLTLMIISASLTAQQTDYQWAKSAGGDHVGNQGNTSLNQQRDMLVDKEGNTYISGNVTDGMSFGDSILNKPYGSFGLHDAMIAKYDKCGKLIWFKIMGNKNEDFVAHLTLSPDADFLYTRTGFELDPLTHDSVIFHLRNRDTVIKGSVWSAFIKIDTKTGDILKYWQSPMPDPSGAIYVINYMYNISPNRYLGLINIVGSYHGETKSGVENFFALLDSDLNILKTRQIDTGQFYYYSDDYDIIFPSINADKYGNIYSEVILQPSNPSNVLHLFDTTFTGLAHGDGIFFQMDTNFVVKRYKKENCLQHVSISADDNLYMAGGVDASFYYDTTHFYGNLANIPYTPIYIKIDTSLNLMGYSYTRHSDYLQYVNLIKATTDKVYVGGLGFSDVKWGQDSLIGAANTYEMAIWEFPKDSIRPTKVHQGHSFVINSVVPYYMGVDEQGNVRIGGNYENVITTAGNTISAPGGPSSPDIFTLDWGLDCADSTHALIAPLEPAGLIATATGQHAVQVTWQDKSVYEHGFHIYRSPDGVSGWTRIDSVVANIAQYIDVNVQPHTAYWYRVAAWNENGESSTTNIDSALTWMDVGIAENNPTLPYINTYPNPATDKVNIEVYSIGAKDATVQMTDINGRSIADDQWHLSDGDNKHEIQMSGLAVGVYYLTIRTASDIVTRKISKMN